MTLTLAQPASETRAVWRSDALVLVHSCIQLSSWRPQALVVSCALDSKHFPGKLSSSKAMLMLMKNDFNTCFSQGVPMVEERQDSFNVWTQVITLGEAPAVCAECNGVAVLTGSSPLPQDKSLSSAGGRERPSCPTQRRSPLPCASLCLVCYSVWKSGKTGGVVKISPNSWFLGPVTENCQPPLPTAPGLAGCWVQIL